MDSVFHVTHLLVLKQEVEAPYETIFKKYIYIKRQVITGVSYLNSSGVLPVRVFSEDFTYLHLAISPVLRVEELCSL